MKVHELILELQNLDPDAEVILNIGEVSERYHALHDITTSHVNERHGLTNEREIDDKIKPHNCIVMNPEPSYWA